ncbi:helix-turn-helix domain-containing protein [Pseudomonas sp. A6]|uniref:helix-turn-helix domain-containing protein n=1 Tax=Pseudomonas sp. A6 TaxID=410021 RepID=UPI00402A524C
MAVDAKVLAAGANLQGLTTKGITTMKNTYLFPKALVLDQAIGSCPTRAELDALRARNHAAELVRVDHSQLNRLLDLSFGSYGLEAQVRSAEEWLYRPQQFQLWLLCSANLEQGVRKFHQLMGWDSGLVSLHSRGLDVNVEADIRGRGALGFSVSFMALWFGCGLQERESLVVNLRQGFEPLGRLLEDRLQLQVRYNQPAVGLSLQGKGICREPLRTSNPILERMLHPGQAHPSLLEKADLVSLAGTLLRDNLANPEYSLSDLAQALCMSPRSLQRKLLAENLSFKELRERQRVSLLKEKLGAGMTKEQVKDLLGYSDVGALYKLLRKIAEPG